ncbi:MAG: HXXEE domain-containing protein [Kofleriaceae bacterium]|nr:HXXEE domain-containing protein [Kofleriaceae bacterium]
MSARTLPPSPLLRSIWLLPCAFALHIVEESRGFTAWVRDVLGGSIGLGAFLVNNAIFMGVLVGLCALATRTRQRWAVIALFFWVAGQVFWNFVFHLFTEIHFGAYSPGLVTATLLYYPLYLFLVRQAVVEGWLTVRWIAASLIAGALGLAFTIWAGLYGFGDVPLSRWLPFCAH